jgi:hypothetical protein
MFVEKSILVATEVLGKAPVTRALCCLVNEHAASAGKKLRWACTSRSKADLLYRKVFGQWAEERKAVNTCSQRFASPRSLTLDRAETRAI